MSRAADLCILMKELLLKARGMRSQKKEKEKEKRMESNSTSADGESSPTRLTNSV